MPGHFVEVDLAGPTLPDLARLPRAALREEGVVWLTSEGRVAFARPEVVRNDEGDVLLRGLPDGARAITSDLAVITEGMHIRVAGEAASR